MLIYLLQVHKAEQARVKDKEQMQKKQVAFAKSAMKPNLKGKVVEEVLTSLLLCHWFGWNRDFNECYLLMIVNVNFVIETFVLLVGKFYNATCNIYGEKSGLVWNLVWLVVNSVGLHVCIMGLKFGWAEI
jgi:hypothetical protein